VALGEGAVSCERGTPLIACTVTYCPEESGTHRAIPLRPFPLSSRRLVKTVKKTVNIVNKTVKTVTRTVNTVKTVNKTVNKTVKAVRNQALTVRPFPLGRTVRAGAVAFAILTTFFFFITLQPRVE